MWGGALGNHQGGVTRFSALWLCVGGGLRDGKVPLPGFWRFAWHSPHFQSLHPLPIHAWHPSSCWPGAESQSGWGCIHSQTTWALFSGVSWKSSSFFCRPNPHWFLQPDVMGIYLPSAGTLGYVIWPGTGILLPRYPSWFLSTTCECGDYPFCCCHLSIPHCICVPLCPSPHLHSLYPSSWM